MAEGDPKVFTILLVEDDPALSTLYQKFFEKEGFKVYAARDGETGLQLATSKLPDFILLDNMLPKITGIELLGLIKKDDKAKSIPVMILSNNTDPEDKQHALDLGALDYIAKASQPPEEIVNKVKGYLNK